LLARLIKVELREGSGCHFAVIGSSEEGAVDLALARLRLEAKAFYPGN